MKNKIIITILTILILAMTYIFVHTLLDYFCTKKNLDKELGNANIDTNNNQIEDNDTIIQVDENSSIRIITKYDENIFKGNKSLIFFWASWCSHCQEEFDIVKTAITDYQNQGYKIYVVSHDYEQSDLAKFMKNNDFNYEVWFDEERVIRAHFNPEASSVPLTYIIDENANLIASHDGPITLEELDNLIHKNM